MRHTLAYLLLLLPAIAAAQDETATEQMPVAPVEGVPPPPPPPPPPLNPGAAGDPNIDRAWISPTAATQPAGSISFNDYELLLVGVTYGITDQAQITALALPPYVKDMPTFLLASFKYSFIPQGKVRIAALASISYLHFDLFDDDGDFDEDEDEDVTIGTIGGALSYCLDDGCASLLSAYVYGAFAFDEEANGNPLIFGASLIYALGRHVKLLLDATTAGIVGDNDDRFAEGALLTYGVRFHTGNIAGDLGLMRTLDFEGDDDTPFILGLPILTFTYRWGGNN